MYKLYSRNNRITVEDESNVIFQAEGSDVRIQIINGVVNIYDLYNKPNSLGSISSLVLGNISNVFKEDGVTGFNTDTELYLYFSEICLSSSPSYDYLGNPSGKPAYIDTTSETLVYEGYPSGSAYRISRIDMSTPIIHRQWATGQWSDRANLNYQ